MTPHTSRLSPSERATWVRRTSSRTVLAVAALALLPSTLRAARSRSWRRLVGRAGAWALVGSLCSWVAVVDHRGLTVRSVAGVRLKHVPLTDVVSARVRTVRAVRDFGGYGWRLALDGTTGLVLRSGEALDVETTSGRRFVITVDDAATAAALLTELAGRARPRAAG